MLMRKIWSRKHSAYIYRVALVSFLLPILCNLKAFWFEVQVIQPYLGLFIKGKLRILWPWICLRRYVTHPAVTSSWVDNEKGSPVVMVGYWAATPFSHQWGLSHISDLSIHMQMLRAWVKPRMDFLGGSISPKEASVGFCRDGACDETPLLTREKGRESKRQAGRKETRLSENNCQKGFCQIWRRARSMKIIRLMVVESQCHFDANSVSFCSP